MVADAISLTVKTAHVSLVVQIWDCTVGPDFGDAMSRLLERIRSVARFAC
jgi:hypothetical protein